MVQIIGLITVERHEATHQIWYLPTTEWGGIHFNSVAIPMTAGGISLDLIGQDDVCVVPCVERFLNLFSNHLDVDDCDFII